MTEGRIPGTGHLQRIVFNEKTEEMRRRVHVEGARQRIREVRKGPTGSCRCSRKKTAHCCDRADALRRFMRNPKLASHQVRNRTRAPDAACDFDTLSAQYGFPDLGCDPTQLTTT